MRNRRTPRLARPSRHCANLGHSERGWGTLRRDHYIPQFILKGFRKPARGKVHFAEKGNAVIRLMPVRDIFFQDHGERVLAKPPKLRQRGETAILASEPEWTEVTAEALQKLENEWARAIKGMIKWVKKLDTNRTRFVAVKCGPHKQEEWVQAIVDYCLRTMFRSEEAGHELWRRLQESEERDLQEWIETELGKSLTPSDELLYVYQRHNRAQTGALADEIFRKRNPEFTVTAWRIVDNSRFIIGSRGGCWVERGELRVFLFPVDPKVAVSLQGKEQVNHILGGNIQLGNSGTVVHHDIPGETGITARMVNEAMWSSCNAVAVGLERRDIEELMRV